MSNLSWFAVVFVLALGFAGALFAIPGSTSCADQMTDARMSGYIDGMRQTTNLFRGVQ